MRIRTYLGRSSVGGGDINVGQSEVDGIEVWCWLSVANRDFFAIFSKAGQFTNRAIKSRFLTRMMPFKRFIPTKLLYLT